MTANLIELQSELDWQRKAYEQATSTVNSLCRKSEDANAKNLEAINAKNEAIKIRNMQINSLRAELRQARNLLDKERLARISSTRQTLDVEEQAVQAQLALRKIQKWDLQVESLENAQPFSTLQNQPFVVVLVDGDRYRVSTVSCFLSSDNDHCSIPVP